MKLLRSHGIFGGRRKTAEANLAGLDTSMRLALFVYLEMRFAEQQTRTIIDDFSLLIVTVSGRCAVSSRESCSNGK